MFNTRQSLVQRAVWIASLMLLPSCVGTELATPSDHPGNPSARSGRLPTSVGLLSDFDASSDPSATASGAHDHSPMPHDSGDAHDSHAGHGASSPHEHEHESATDDSSQPPESAGPGDATGDSAVGYTCPMHPEVVQGGPGTCPKCGMKLVPKAKGPK